MLMMHYAPAEVLYLHNNLDDLAQHVLTSAEGVQAVSEVPPCDAKAWSLPRAVAALSAPEMFGPLDREFLCLFVYLFICFISIGYRR